MKPYMDLWRGKRGYCHGLFQFGNLDSGLKVCMIVELEDGNLIKEDIDYLKFID